MEGYTYHTGIFCPGWDIPGILALKWDSPTGTCDCTFAHGQVFRPG